MAQTVWELTAAVASGDREAFAEFYRNWFEVVLGHAQRIVHADESVCMDITQDVFMRVIRSMPAMEDRTSIERWLIRVTRSSAMDRMRAELRRKRREQSLARRAIDDAEASSSALNEKIAWLESELQRMPEPSHELLTLRFRLGWTLQRIGLALGLKPGAVDGRISRIIRGLQRRAEETFSDE